MSKFAKKTKEEIEALTPEQLATYNEELAKFEKEQSAKDDAGKKEQSSKDDAGKKEKLAKDHPEEEGNENKLKAKKVKAFQTSDKVNFWVKNDADNHARTLEDSSVKEVLIESK